MPSKIRQKKKVLHLSTHLGGGVGTVLLNYLKAAKEKSDFAHKVLVLGYSEDKVSKAVKEIGLEYKDDMSRHHLLILEEINKADVVLVHWWNHPLIYEFLVRNKLPANRLAIWSHISGYHPPQVFTPKILHYPDKFVFTTPISLETQEVIDLPDIRKQDLKVVLATGGVEHLENIKPIKHHSFNIGYIGTVDYAKTHPNFLKMCRKIKIPEAKFIVCGGSHEREMQQESVKLGIAHRFHFTGRIDDIVPYLSSFDIFGYPLAPNHYGACDQVLIESMAAGVVPVVLKNKMESYMVKDKMTGLVVRNMKEYVDGIHMLYYKPGLRASLAKNAREYAKQIFSVDKALQDWEGIFAETLHMEKTEKSWPISKKQVSPYQIFLESLGDHGQIFLKHLQPNNLAEKKKTEKKMKLLGKMPSWQSDSKGTVHNYSAYFPQDKNLRKWSQLMKS